jgi:UDP-3-O-[3-hydroxymyristoyl] glucosamine N-acyltransferase
MMAHSVKDIAAALGAEAFGAVDLLIEGASEPATATASDLALAMTPAYGDALAQGAAQAAVVWSGADWQALGLKAAIIAPRARLAMAGLTQMLDRPLPADGISTHAAIDPSAQLGRNVRIGAFAVIGPDAVICDNTWIGDHVSIAAGVTVGADCQIHAGVRLQRGTRLGARVIVQPNVAIGGDGFSFVTAEPSNVELARETLGEGALAAPADPRWHRIHSLGGVVIGDDVEVGSNSCIDAGTIRATQVGEGTKIDSLVQVGHNVIVGAHCLLCAQAGVAGSTVIGNRVIVGGKAGVADNLKIGDDVVLGGGSIVLSHVPAGRVMMGYPATKIQTHIEGYKAMRRLPRTLRDLAKRS